MENDPMTSIARNTLLALGFAVVTAGAAVPAVAVPVQSGAAGLQAAVTDNSVIAVRVERKARKRLRHRHQASRQGQSGPEGPYASPNGWQGPDTVGSLGQDGYGYGYNRFSGQRYQSCVFDEGYGRTRPCDAGGGGGGRP
jgi:hypothetical protein